MRIVKKIAMGLAAVFLCGLCFGMVQEARQKDLASQVIRLHVLAASDSEEDQTNKLAVRDAVLAAAQPIVDGAKTAEEAKELLSDALPDLAAAGETALRDAGCAYAVTATLSVDHFPTREYEDFSLPAGNYTALRIVIGEGEGHNWWCVVFPPLCMGSVTEETAESFLTEDAVKLITEDNEDYVLRFKALELWDSLKSLLTKDA